MTSFRVYRGWQYVLGAGMLLMVFCVNAVVQLSQLTYLTEEYPPYNFTDGHQLQGVAVDLLVAASAQVDQPVLASQIQVLPWSRAYGHAQHATNTVLFSTTRTAARESLFQWVGPIASIRIVLIARKIDAISLSGVEDMKAYRIGVIREDIGEALLQDLGLSDNLVDVGNADSLAKMLERGRIQLWAYEESVARWFCKQSQVNFNQFEVVYVLKEAELFYALSPNVDTEVVQSLQQGIDQLKRIDAQTGLSPFDIIKQRYFDE